MKKPVPYTDDALKALKYFLSFWPLISRARQQEKIEIAVNALLHRRGAKNVDRDILLSALQDSHPSFETFITGLRDPAGIQAVIASQQAIDEEHPLIRIQRWELPEVSLHRPVQDVFALLAGPRINGNTDCILDSVLGGMSECGCTVEKAYFSKLDISPCKGCLACQAEHPPTTCAQKDDMLRIYTRLQECDAFVLGFPIYSARESSHTTIFFDRLKALSNPWKPKKPEPKKGIIVSTWGWPTDDLYQDVIHNIAFLIRHFGVETAEVITGCGFWGAYYKAGTARLDTQGMEQARSAGRDLCIPS